MFTNLLRDARIGVRLVWRRPGLSAIAVFTLALGISCTTAIFSVVYATFLEPLPYRDPERLVMVWSHFEGQRNMVGPRFFVEWKRQATVFEGLDAWSGRAMDLAAPGGRPEQIQVGITTPTWLPMFGYGQPLAFGRNFLPEEGRPGHDRVVIMNHRMWRERFGADPHIIGRDIRLDRTPYTVVGVLGPGPADTNLPLWVPLAFDGYRPDPDYEWGLYVMGRLKAGVTIEQANAEMDAISGRIERLHKDAAGWTASVEPFRNNFLSDGTKRGLWLLLGAVGFVLLIACANVANLLLARGTARQRELAIRASIGASRGHIVRQLLVESVVLAVIGGALGAALASGLLNVVLTLMPPNMLPTEADIRISLPVLLFTTGACVLSGVLAGAAPAWQAARADLNEGLKEGARTLSAGGGWLRRALIVVEFALALTLLTGGGLAAHSLYTLATTELGFNAERLLTFSIAHRAPETRFKDQEHLVAWYRTFVERLQALPGVTSASLSVGLPSAGSVGGIPVRRANDRSDSEWTSAALNIVTPGYFRTFGVRMVRGRPLNDRDREGAVPVAVINERFARHYFPNVDPVGQRVILRDWTPPEWEIVGVFADIRNLRVGLDAAPEIDIPLWQAASAIVRVAIRTSGEPTSLLPSVAAVVASLDAEMPISDVKTMEQLVAETMVTDRFNSVLFGSFALAGLLLAALGIYGVMSFMVAQRTREIGVRVALGASRRNILADVIRQGMGTALVGTLVGCAGAFAVVRIMQGVIWGVDGLRMLPFTLVTLTLLAAALIACIVPARRAASVDPIVALRQE